LSCFLSLSSNILK